MLNDVYRKINIKIGPIQMAAVPKLDVADLLDIGALEPRELLKGEKVLAIVEKYPKTMLRDVCNLRCRNAFSTLCRSHSYAPRLSSAIASTAVG
jgi:hypothetical protein